MHVQEARVLHHRAEHLGDGCLRRVPPGWPRQRPVASPFPPADPRRHSHVDRTGSTGQPSIRLFVSRNLISHTRKDS